MAPFPSLLERTVASALLLLSTKPPSLSSPKSSFDRESKSSWEELSLASTESVSSISDLRSDGSSQEIRARKLRFAAVAARRREMTLKVVRKSRSKLYHSTGQFKVSAFKTAYEMVSGSESTEVSCLSSSSTARSPHVTRGEIRDRMALGELKKHGGASAQIRCRAEAILKFLSGKCSSEVKIRQVLGDSPDTSKALRMLLKLEEIKRSGTGGRQDPYIYMIA